MTLDREGYIYAVGHTRNNGDDDVLAGRFKLDYVIAPVDITSGY